MDDIEECWNQLQVGGIINEVIPLNEFLEVDEDVIVNNEDGNSIADEEKDLNEL